MITVYTKDKCPQCDATIRVLTRMGVQYETKDAVGHAEHLRNDLGYTSAPVIVAGRESWSGFRPDKLAGLK